MKMLACLFTLLFCLNEAAYSQGVATDAKEATKSYEFPASDEGQPGEGALRRLKFYVNLWNTERPKWGARLEQDAGGVVFLGDSITEGWGDNFFEQFTGMKAVNRGISADTTRGMLIRLEEDVLLLKPKAIVMLMGTNDIADGIEPEAISRNVKLILEKIYKHDPQLPIILCQMFPSNTKNKRPSEKIKKINELNAALVKGNKQVTLIDTWSLFAGADGDCDPAYFPDRLHINEAGYKRWANAIRPVLATLGFLETTADDFKPEPGFVSLFNGKDLTGWGYLPMSPPKNPKPGAPVVPVRTEPIWFEGMTQSDDGRYQAIHGRIVVVTPPEGRKVAQLWTKEEFGKDFTLKLEFRATPNADSGVFIRKPQLQCRDYPLAGPYKELKGYKTGDWNELEVVVKGLTAKATCNGEVLEEAMKLPESGPIGLEGDRGQMEYRRIRIKVE